MPIPSYYKPLSSRLGRFLSKEPTEAEDPYSDQSEANLQMVGDYSVTPENFYIKPPVGIMYELHRVLILIRDNNNMSSNEYISTGPLTVGINFEVRTNGMVSIANSIPIKRINDYGSYAGIDVRPFDNELFPNAFGVRWTFSKAGDPLFLNGDNEEGIYVVLNDDFTSLTAHTALMQGVIHNTDVYNR